MAKLCNFPNTKPEDNNPRLRESYASAAESVKKTLISNLESCDTNTDVKYMIDLSNVAFASLSSFQADFVDLYGLVKDLIRYRCSITEAKRELESHGITRDGFFYARKNDLKRRKCESSAASFNGAKNALCRALEDVAVLEEKLAKANQKVDALRAESDKSRPVLTDIEEMGKVLDRFSSRFRDANAGFERTKVKLSAFE